MEGRWNKGILLFICGLTIIFNRTVLQDATWLTFSVCCSATITLLLLTHETKSKSAQVKLWSNVGVLIANFHKKDQVKYYFWTGPALTYLLKHLTQWKQKRVLQTPNTHSFKWSVSSSNTYFRICVVPWVSEQHVKKLWSEKAQKVPQTGLQLSFMSGLTMQTRGCYPRSSERFLDTNLGSSSLCGSKSPKAFRAPRPRLGGLLPGWMDGWHDFDHPMSTFFTWLMPDAAGASAGCAGINCE